MNIDAGVFLVTGAASGLGEEVARRLADAGARVVGLDLHPPAANDGPCTVFCAADICDESGVASAFARAEALGAVRGVVHCAGIAPAAKLLGRDGPHSLEQFRRTVEINLVGSFNVLRLSAASIAKSAPLEDGERGAIVLTASVAAFEGQIGQAAYAASKAGVVGMTLPAARELARSGIRVVTLAPGIMDTPMMATMPPEVRESLGAAVPFPSRLGRPSEFAALAVHVLENSYLNGEVIRIDGAIRMNAR